MDTLTSEQEKSSQTKLQENRIALSQLIRHEWNVTKAVEYKQSPFRFLFWPLGLAWNLTRSLSWSLFFFASRFLSKSPRTIKYDFTQAFESIHGKLHLPFLQQNYSQALEKAKRQRAILLVILQSDEHDDTDLFCRQTLASKEMIDYIAKKNILVWAGNVKETESHQVSYALKATRYPFMALIQYKGSEMTVMQRIQGPCDPQILKDKIDALYIQDPRQRERQLREEQDEAYYRSLEADQEKEKRAKRERQEKVEAKEKEKQEKKRKEILQEKRAVYIRYLYTQLPEEPQEGKVTKLSFRLANGDRVVRLFSEQDSLDTLYRFVQVVPLLNEPIEPCEPPQDYEHQYTFKIHSPYPRIEYEASKSKKLVDISNLWPSANLVVEDE